MLLCFFVIVGVVFLDQLSKCLTVLYIGLEENVPVIDGIVGLTFRKNTGAAFSMWDEPDERWIFMSISTVALTLLAVYMFAPRPQWLQKRVKFEIPPRPQGWLLRLSLAFILGGGIGNMIDRTILGYVVDMIEVYFIDFAVFNVADSFVCVGAGLMILAFIIDMVKEEKAAKAAKKAAAAESTPDGEARDE